MRQFAYLDPGTGSMIMQAIIGGVVAVGVLLKAYWGKIKGLFGGKKKSDAPKSESKKTEEE